MTPHDTPAAATAPLAVYPLWQVRGVVSWWQDRETRDRLPRLLPRLSDAGLLRLLLGSPEEAAKLMQEVATDDRR